MVKEVAKTHTLLTIISTGVCVSFFLFSNKVDINGESYISLPSFEKNTYVGEIGLNGCFIYDIKKPSWDSVFNINVSLNPLNYSTFTSNCLEKSEYYLGKEKIITEVEDKNTGEISKNITYKYYFNINKNPYVCFVDETLFNSNSNSRCIKFEPYYSDVTVQKVVISPFLNLSLSKNESAYNFEYKNEDNLSITKYEIAYKDLVFDVPNLRCNNQSDCIDLFFKYLDSKYFIYDKSISTFYVYPIVLDIGVIDSKAFEIKCMQDRAIVKEFIYKYK